MKVVIIGQDPYHGPGQAHGLCFSVNDGVPFPPSLVNIFKEIKADIGTDAPATGNLTRWAEQGVLLLNATLTVRAHQAGSHQNRGWETFTDAAIRALAEEKENLVFILWGSYAQKKGAFIDRVENGQEAVDTFKKHAKNYYDLILMDIQMPQMDGYEATQIIRTMESGKAIPIFALSADAYVENKRYSKEMGMDGHFSKPIDFDVMEKELSEYFSRRDA